MYIKSVLVVSALALCGNLMGCNGGNTVSDSDWKEERLEYRRVLAQHYYGVRANEAFKNGKEAECSKFADSCMNEFAKHYHMSSQERKEKHTDLMDDCWAVIQANHH